MKVRIMKKTASEIFKKIVGTDKGMEKSQRNGRDVWFIQVGVLKVSLEEKPKFDLFGHAIEGDYWKIHMNVTVGDAIYLFVKKDTLEIDDDYRDEVLGI